MNHFANFCLGACLVFVLLFFGIGVYKIMFFVLGIGLGMPDHINVFFSAGLAVTSIVFGFLNVIISGGISDD